MPRRARWPGWVVVAGTILVLNGVATAGPRSHLRIFQYASPIPSGCEAAKHLTQAAALPFTGIVIDPVTGVDQGGPAQFSRGFWGGGLPDSAVVEAERRCVEQLQSGRAAVNLVRVAVIPGTVDWFDEWTPIWDRLDLLATFMRSGGFRGIFVDPELYGGHFPIFTYPRQKYASTRSFEAYSRQAYTRGAEFITRLQRIRPDLVIVFAFAFERPWADALRNSPLDRSPYGLLPAFLNGILAQSGHQVTLIDGYEQAYGYRAEVQFALARQVFDNGVLSLVTSPDKYHSRFRLGFGIWLNYDAQHVGWSATSPESNYYSPQRFADWLTWAQRYSDGFAWIYTERLDWSDPAQVPPAYLRILANFSGP